MLDEELSQDFAKHMKTDFATAAQNFQNLWPIFSSKDLGYNAGSADNRAARIKQYSKIQPPPGHKPPCAFEHSDRKEIPIDWPHTISAIYQVRCNLFHGYKGLHSENDVLIVSKAFRILIRLLPMLLPEVALPPRP